MVGEFHYQTYNSTSDTEFSIILWLWFVTALIVTQILFLNTLIAIISETFDRVWDQRKMITIR